MNYSMTNTFFNSHLSPSTGVMVKLIQIFIWRVKLLSKGDLLYFNLYCRHQCLYTNYKSFFPSTSV